MAQYTGNPLRQVKILVLKQGEFSGNKPLQFWRSLSWSRAVLRIRDVYPGSEFFPSRIPDPGSKRFPDPGYASASKNLSTFSPKKLFLSSRKYDPGCPSQIRIPDTDLEFLPIPDPGIKKRHRRIPDPDPQHWSWDVLSRCKNQGHNTSCRQSSRSITPPPPPPPGGGEF